MRRNLINEYTFDNGVGDWYEKSMYDVANDAIVSTQVVREGKSCKITLRKGQNDRTELGTSPYTAPREGWYGFSLFFPLTFENDSRPESIVQWQSFPDPGENFRSAPLFLGVLNGQFILDQRVDLAKISTGSTVTHKRDVLGTATKNVWHDFVVHAKWSLEADGIIEIWKNDIKIFTKSGANCYNDPFYPYMKIGIYKWDYPESSIAQTVRSIYIDEVRIGTELATYNDVYPGKKLVKTTKYFHDGTSIDIYP